MKKTVTIIGGCGHVGLPFGVVLAYHGNMVNLLDINQNAIDTVNRGECPFEEEIQVKETLKQYVSKGKIVATDDPTCISSSDLIIFITGTPIDHYGDPDFESFFNIIDLYIPYLKNNQDIILRSTVYPGTTKLLRNRIKSAGYDQCFVGYCPERIVQGKGWTETHALPQMIGVDEPMEFEAISKYFNYIPKFNLIEMKSIEAELGKLFTNSYRYIQFAVANQFSLIANKAGVDFDVIRRGMTQNYDRLKDFPTNGLAGGPCLIKDTMQLSSFFDKNFTLGEISFKVNEGYALNAVSIIKHHFGDDLSEKNIVLLGMTFKPDNDDIRDSLSYKIKKYLKPLCNKVDVCDPYLTVEDDKDLVQHSDIFNYDCAIVCTPHVEFSNIMQEWSERGRGEILNLWGNFRGK